MRRGRGAALVAGLLVVAGAQGRAHAEPGRDLFALVIGVNRSVDPDQAPLRYADDDAIRFRDLLLAHGAQVELLTRADANTGRLHPEAAATAAEPRAAQLQAAVTRLGAAIATSRRRGGRPALYLFYAGHGQVKGGRGYLALEDARLTAHDLSALLGQLAADEAHVIVDACNSFFLAQARGPGGQRRPLQGFTQLTQLASQPRVGLLLSTSTARESHEWSAFQAGVFSHQVRSGLHGAADVDGDGQVSYREIAAFVARANAAIPNERFRPEVYARPPRHTAQLLDLRAAQGRRLHLDGTRHGHFLLEDGAGVRLAEFNNGPGQVLTIHLPPPRRGGRPLYLHEVGKDREYLLPGPAPVEAAGPLLELASLTPHAPAVGSRGAAHEAFGLIFSLPFDRRLAEAHVLPGDDEPATTPDVQVAASSPRSWWRRPGPWVSAGLSVAALGTGLALTLSARTLRAGVPAGASGFDVSRVNTTIRAYDIAAPVLYAVAGTAAITAVTLAVWPRLRKSPRPFPVVTLWPGGAAAGLSGTFGR
jgi:hypothetical protein